MSSKIISFPSNNNTVFQKIIPKKQKVLHIGASHYISADSFAYDLFSELKEKEELEPSFLAISNSTARKNSSLFGQYSPIEQSATIFSGSEVDEFYLKQKNLQYFISNNGLDIKTYISNIYPDFVHIHDISLTGIELIPLIKFNFPNTKIIVSISNFDLALHKNYSQDAINNFRSDCVSLSNNADISTAEFKIRQSLILSHLSLADVFVVPNENFKKLYADWGLDVDKIVSITQSTKISEEAHHKEEPKRGTILAWYSNSSEKEISSLLKVLIREKWQEKWLLKVVSDTDFDINNIVDNFLEHELNEILSVAEFERLQKPAQSLIKEFDLLWLATGTPYYLASIAGNSGKVIAGELEMSSWYDLDSEIFPVRLNNYSSISEFLRNTKVSYGRQKEQKNFTSAAAEFIKLYQ